jgi:hypothetical protein
VRYGEQDTCSITGINSDFPPISIEQAEKKRMQCFLAFKEIYEKRTSIVSFTIRRDYASGGCFEASKKHTMPQNQYLVIEARQREPYLIYDPCFFPSS